MEPGENSDPEFLGFTYTVQFVDSTIISLDIKFDSPMYVSANQPEDFLVVTFWGPFYD